MTVTEDTTWRAQAACRGLPTELATELFFPDSHFASKAFAQQLARAYSICDGCPVKEECLTYGESRGEVGVWGGQYLGAGAEVGVGSGLNGFIRMRDGVPEPKRVTNWDTLKRARNIEGASGSPTLAEYVKREATIRAIATTPAHQEWVRRRNPEVKPTLSPDWNDRSMRNGTALHAEQVYIETGIAALEDRWVTVAELVEQTGLTVGVVQHVLHHLLRTGQITERDPRLRRAYQAVL